MAMATVTITRPERRDVYINGNYAERPRRSAPDTMTLESGGYIATTLNDAGKVDFRGRFSVDEHGTPVRVALDPVDPPEDI